MTDYIGVYKYIPVKIQKAPSSWLTSGMIVFHQLWRLFLSDLHLYLKIQNINNSKVDHRIIISAHMATRAVIH